MNVCDSLTAASCCDTDWLMCLLCNHLSQYYVDQLNDCYNLREGWTHIIVTSCALLSSSFVACTTREGCVAPNADISLQSGRFWATVIASSSERLLDLRSCWIVFIHVVRGRPGGFLQSSEGEAVMILLASVSSGILAIWPNRERRRAWTIADRRGCPVVRLTSSFRTWWYHHIWTSLLLLLWMMSVFTVCCSQWGVLYWCMCVCMSCSVCRV